MEPARGPGRRPGLWRPAALPRRAHQVPPAPPEQALYAHRAPAGHEILQAFLLVGRKKLVRALVLDDYQCSYFGFAQLGSDCIQRFAGRAAHRLDSPCNGAVARGSRFGVFGNDSNCGHRAYLFSHSISYRDCREGHLP